MRLHHLSVLLLLVCLYVFGCYLAVAVLPDLIVPDTSYATLETTERETLIVNARNSVRTAAVTLLTGSALGVVGFVGLLTFVNARRDADRNERVSQDALFSEGLKVLNGQDAAVVVGAVTSMANVAQKRVDLRVSVLASLFTLVRRNCALVSALSPTPEQLNVRDLIDRDPTSAVCLRLIGELSLGADQTTSGAVLRRRLDGCDFRRIDLDNVSYVLVNFSGSYFWECRLHYVTFVKCVFRNTDWRGATLDHVRFESCDLSLADFSSAVRRDVELVGCTGGSALVGS